MNIGSGGAVSCVTYGNLVLPTRTALLAFETHPSSPSSPFPHPFPATRSSEQNLELGDDAVVLDVCCGAGTIGICAAAAGGAKQVRLTPTCDSFAVLSILSITQLCLSVVRNTVARLF